MEKLEMLEESGRLEYTPPELLVLDMGVEVVHGVSGDDSNEDETPGEIVVI